MTYVRKTWQNDKAGGTQITADELNRIEQGVADAHGGSGSDASALKKASNLSDISSASAARTNLGLGNVDNTADSAKPVSTAQGTADTAVQTAAASDATTKANAAQAAAIAALLTDVNTVPDFSGIASTVVNARALDVLIDKTRDAPGGDLRRKDGAFIVPDAWTSIADPTLLPRKINGLAAARLAYSQTRTSYQGSATRKGLPPVSQGIDLDLFFPNDREYHVGYNSDSTDVGLNQKKPTIRLIPGLNIYGEQSRIVNHAPVSNPGPCIGTPYRPYSETAICATGTKPVRSNGQIVEWSTATDDQMAYRSGGRGTVTTGATYTEWRYAYTPQAIITADVARNATTVTVDNVDGIDRAWFTAKSISIPATLTANKIVVGDWVLCGWGQNPDDAHERIFPDVAQVVAIKGTTTPGFSDTGAGTITLSRPAPVDLTLANEYWSFPATASGKGAVFHYQASGSGGVENVDTHSLTKIDPTMWCHHPTVEGIDFLPHSTGLSATSYLQFAGAAVNPLAQNVRGFSPGLQVVDFNGLSSGRMVRCSLFGSNSDASSSQNVGMLFDLTSSRDITGQALRLEGFYGRGAQIESYSRFSFKGITAINDHPSPAATQALFALNGQSSIDGDDLTWVGGGGALVARAGGQDEVVLPVQVGGNIFVRCTDATKQFNIRAHDLKPSANHRRIGVNPSGTAVDWKFGPVRRWRPLVIPFTVAPSTTVTVDAALPPGVIRSLDVTRPSSSTGLVSLKAVNGVTTDINFLGVTATHVTGAFDDTTVTSSTSEFTGSPAIGDTFRWSGGNLDGTDFVTTLATVTGAPNTLVLDDALPRTLAAGQTVSVGDPTVAGSTVRANGRLTGLWSGTGISAFSSGKIQAEAAGTPTVVRAVFDTTVADATADIIINVETFPQLTAAGSVVPGSTSTFGPTTPTITTSYDKTTYPIVGQILTALRNAGLVKDQTTDAGVTSWPSQYAIRTTDSAAVNNSSTFVVSAVLLVPLVANATYKFRALIQYDCDAAADLKLGWTVPTGAVGKWTPGGYQNGVAGAATSATISRGQFDIATGATIGGIGAGSIITASPEGYVTTDSTHSGNLTFRYAQSTAQANDLFIRAGSWMEVTRIA